MPESVRIGIFIDGTFVPPRDGASARFAHLPRSLAELGHQVTVFHCYRGWSDLHQVAQEPFPTYVFHPDVFYGDMDCLTGVVRERGINVLQMDAPETIRSIGIPLAAATGARIVYDSLYHTSTLAKALGESRERVDELRAIEREMATETDRILVLTDADRDRWLSQSDCSQGRISVVPFGVEDVASEPPSGDDIVFLGNLFFEPNRRAVVRIACEILPRLRVLRPGATATVIGDIPADLRELCVQANIQVAGEVANPRRLLDRAGVGIAPVSESSGVRVKILDYLAAGLPVVASSTAAEGLDFPAVFIAEDSRRAADRCANILENRASYDAAVRQTLARLRERLWPNIAKATHAVYETVLRSAPVIRRSTHGLSRPPLRMPLWMQAMLRSGRFANLAPTVPWREPYRVLGQDR